MIIRAYEIRSHGLSKNNPIYLLFCVSLPIIHFDLNFHGMLDYADVTNGVIQITKKQNIKLKLVRLENVIRLTPFDDCYTIRLEIS